MSRSVAVHPLAIVGIADHHTRVVKGGGTQRPSDPAVGLLLGTRRGLQCKVMDSVDLSYRDTGTRIVIEESQVETKRALTMAVFPDYEVLGWYTVGAALAALHNRIHDTIAGIVSSPLFLLMKPLGMDAGRRPGQEDDALPIGLYESGPAAEDFGFRVVSFQLETAEAEQISIEHVAKVTPKEGATKTELYLSGLITSLSTLQSRVSVITDYLDRVAQEPGAEADPALLRSVAQLASLLPTVKPDSELNGSTSAHSFADSLESSVTDGLMKANLSAMTNASLVLGKLTEKFSLAFESRLQ